MAEYREVHVIDQEKLTEEEYRIWQQLSLYRGKGREVPGVLIAQVTGMEYTRIRSIIAHLINYHHKLIGSNGRGYFVPVTAEEITEVTKSLRHRGIMIPVRAARLQQTSLVEIFNQATLEFEKERRGSV